MEQNNCPEFPHFGASYPDARCINGYLWDLDKCNDDGSLYGGGDDPCPFCNTESYKEFLSYSDADNQEKQRINDHIELLHEKYKL